MRWSLICTILLIIYTQNIEAAKILVLATVSSHSHAIFTNAITSALAARGHELVVLSPDKEKRAIRNITTIYLEGGYDDKLYNINLEEMPSSEGLLDYFRMYTEFSTHQCQTLLFSPGNKKFHRDHRDHKFDLILFDIGCSECFLKYAHVFGHPPIVAYSAFYTIQPHNLGNFYNPAYVPHFATGFGDRMKFNERFTNWLYYQYNSLWRRYLYLPAVDRISDTFFGFSEPKIADLEREISLMLTDDHFSISLPRPNVPAVVDVAGLQIKPAKALPDELKEFVEGAKHGVIFFSLGSNFLSKHMSQQRKQMFLEAFSQLPQRVVWKYEDETLKNLPKNVLLKKWCPQTDILGHNNTVLFMTHNGYLSTQESIYFGVPMLGMPVIVDQFQNNAKMVKAGVALRLDLKEINSTEQIRNKIITILNNPSFREKAQQMSMLFRDRPMTPLDTAIYWIEYVLRHKGAKQLRVASLDLAWYQYYLLDIYFVIAAAFFALYYVLVAFFRAILSDEPKEKEA